MTTSLLQKWGFDGYVRWLRGIKATYRTRKTWLCDTFDDYFHIEFDAAPNGVATNSAVRDVMDFGRGVTCYAKQYNGPVDEKRILDKRGPPLVSFIPPTAGMFVFLALHLDSHPDFKKLEQKGEDATRVLMERLWHELADHLVRPPRPNTG
jgi:aromatic amino acid aminotransferase I